MFIKSITSATFVSLCLLSTHAHATASISCGATNSETGAKFILGAGPIPSVYSATVASDTAAYSTSPIENHEPASIARSYIDDETIKIDLVDDQATNVVAKIRIIRTEDPETGPFQIGYIQMLGAAPEVVTCDGP
ncbi:MAG: hypothetical protein ABJH63_10665 [Rhizobiaceae bacterium]